MVRGGLRLAFIVPVYLAAAVGAVVLAPISFVWGIANGESVSEAACFYRSAVSRVFREIGGSPK